VKILLVADIHYDLRKFDWVVEAAGLVDVVVLAGDHLEIASMVERPAQAIVAQKYFRRIGEKVPLLISSGNHDLDGPDADGELAARWIQNARFLGVPTDGDSRLIGDTLFTMCPWWDGGKQQAKIGELLARDAAARPARWIWVYHAPPEGSPTSWGGRKSYGDAPLRGWIERYQPDIVLGGHVHQAPFVPDGSWADRIGNTWVFNPGHQVGPVPAHVVIDSDGPRAYWLSLTREETAGLDAALERPLARIGEQPAWLASMAQLGTRRLA
jgi:Icc-related predicted phosphoesterase